jgi:hypothetical protein
VAEGYRRHWGTGELTDELTPSGTGMAEVEEVFNNAPPSRILMYRRDPSITVGTERAYHGLKSTMSPNLTTSKRRPASSVISIL